MKIIILGAGQVGGSVAESLVSEQNDITVVDVDPPRLRALQDRLDLRTVSGSAAHPSVLSEAGADDADLLIAVTQSDETNLAACKIAARLFNVPRRVARIRATDYLNDERLLGAEGFEVDLSHLGNGWHKLIAGIFNMPIMGTHYICAENKQERNYQQKK